MLLFAVVFLINIGRTKPRFPRGTGILHLAVRSVPRGGRCPPRVYRYARERNGMKDKTESV